MNATTDSLIMNRNVNEQLRSNGKPTRRWRIWKTCRGDLME